MGKEQIMRGKSIGVVIMNEKGLYLVQYRLKHPIGLAMPAGHIEEGETPEQALHRELLEEANLRIVSFEEVLHGVFDNPCPKGHDGHEWWVYRAKVSGEPRLMEPTKHKFLKWMSVNEMQAYVDHNDTDPGWFKYILPALGIL